MDEVEIATAEWVDWSRTAAYTNTAADIPPAELEAAHYAPNNLTPSAEVSRQ